MTARRRAFHLAVIVAGFGLLTACAGIGLPDEGEGQTRYPHILSEAPSSTPTVVEIG